MLSSNTDVPGLSFIPNYISPAEQEHLLTIIDQQPWLDSLKRRVQHYGYRYDYKKRAVEPEMYLGKLPEWILPLTERLYGEKLIDDLDQVIINEYQPGQGISGHVDCIPCFGDTILSLSLGSSCVMIFTQVDLKQDVRLLLEPGGLIVMKNDARYKWKHSIPARKSDVFEGHTIQRERRVSITLRKVIQQ